MTRVTALGLHIEGIGDLRALRPWRRTAHASPASRSSRSRSARRTGAKRRRSATRRRWPAAMPGRSACCDRLGSRGAVAQGLMETLKLAACAPARWVESDRRRCPVRAARRPDGGSAERPRRADFPPLTRRVRRSRLRAALGPKVALANPLDYHTYIWADEEAMTAAYRRHDDGPTMPLGLCGHRFPRADRCDPGLGAGDRGAPRTQRADRHAHGRGRQPAGDLPEDTAERLMARGIARLGAGRRRLRRSRRPAAAGAPTARAALGPARARRQDTIDRTRGQGRLPALVGRMSRQHRALAARGRGGPKADRAAASGCVLKGEGVAHKTEAGGVALNLARCRGGGRGAPTPCRAEREVYGRRDGDGAVAELLSAWCATRRMGLC